jgi:3-hydroxyisobutyrate dehydrogenase
MCAASIGNPQESRQQVGWIGAGGRMGFAMATRLLEAGYRVRAFNRTRVKAEPLAAYGAVIVDTPAQLADCPIVFTTVGTSTDLLAVATGDNGVLSAPQCPELLIDCSSVSTEASAALRAAAAARGAAMLAAPVSGNSKAVEAGALTIVASGPRDAFDRARPVLAALGRGVSYVGDGEHARIVKICHNLMLGIVAQCMAEICLLAEKSGVRRSALLQFINDSVMGSIFTRYKTPAYVNLDMTPTFTPVLLSKDLQLGLDAAAAQDVPLPLTALTHRLVQRTIDSGHVDCDFAVLLLEQAQALGLTLESEQLDLDDGLSARTD